MWAIGAYGRRRVSRNEQRHGDGDNDDDERVLTSTLVVEDYATCAT